MTGPAPRVMSTTRVWHEHTSSPTARSHSLSHSEVDEGDQGILSQFRYTGPTDGEHVLETSPLNVAPMAQLLRIDEQHPCDIESVSAGLRLAASR